MKHGLFFVLGLLVFAAGISAAVDVSADANALTGLVVSATPSPSAEASVQAVATVSATLQVESTPTPLPVKDRVSAANDRRVQIQANVKDRVQNVKERVEAAKENTKVKERVEDTKENAKERVKEIRDDAKGSLEQEKQRRQDVHEAAQEKIRDLKEQRQKNVADARLLEADLAAKVKALKAKNVLNETERDDLKEKTRLHLLASYRHRIELAQKMGAEGANASLVAEFVAYAETNWNQYANATNNSARKDLINAFNQRWRAFKQAVTKDLLLAKLRTSVNASRQTLNRLDAVIAKLTAGGFNTTALVNASASISARLDSVLLEPDVPHAIARLRQVHSGLVHLRNAIQRTVNRELVEAYREKPAPSVAADASLSITGSSDASAIATAGATASATATDASGSAGSSGTASANASA